MFIYCFICAFLYCLAPSEFTGWLFIIAIGLGAIIDNQNTKLEEKAKHADRTR